MTKKELILEFVESKGTAKATEIQKFIYEQNHPLRRWDPRLNRGYYCDKLYRYDSWLFKGDDFLNRLPGRPVTFEVVRYYYAPNNKPKHLFRPGEIVRIKDKTGSPPHDFNIGDEVELILHAKDEVSDIDKWFAKKMSTNIGWVINEADIEPITKETKNIPMKNTTKTPKDRLLEELANLGIVIVITKDNRNWVAYKENNSIVLSRPNDSARIDSYDDNLCTPFTSIYNIMSIWTHRGWNLNIEKGLLLWERPNPIPKLFGYDVIYNTELQAFQVGCQTYSLNDILSIYKLRYTITEVNFNVVANEDSVKMSEIKEILEYYSLI